MTAKLDKKIDCLFFDALIDGHLRPDQKKFDSSNMLNKINSSIIIYTQDEDEIMQWKKGNLIYSDILSKFNIVPGDNYEIKKVKNKYYSIQFSKPSLSMVPPVVNDVPTSFDIKSETFLRLIQREFDYMCAKASYIFNVTKSSDALSTYAKYNIDKLECYIPFINDYYNQLIYPDKYFYNDSNVYIIYVLKEYLARSVVFFQDLFKKFIDSPLFEYSDLKSLLSDNRQTDLIEKYIADMNEQIKTFSDSDSKKNNEFNYNSITMKEVLKEVMFDMLKGPLHSNLQRKDYIDNWINCRVTLSEWLQYPDISIPLDIIGTNPSAVFVDKILKHQYGLYSELVDLIYNRLYKSSFDSITLPLAKMSIAKRDYSLIEDIINSNIDDDKEKSLRTIFGITDRFVTAVQFERLMKNKNISDGNYDINSKDCYAKSEALLKYHVYISDYLKDNDKGYLKKFDYKKLEKVDVFERPYHQDLEKFLFRADAYNKYKDDYSCHGYYHYLKDCLEELMPVIKLTYLKVKYDDRTMFKESYISHIVFVSKNYIGNMSNALFHLKENGLTLDHVFEKITTKNNIGKESIFYFLKHTYNDMVRANVDYKIKDLHSSYIFLISDFYIKRLVTFIESLPVTSTISSSASNQSSTNNNPMPIQNSYTYVHYKNDSSKLADLLVCLKKNNFVHDKTPLAAFDKIFSNRKPNKPIIWTGGIQSLNYFVKLLHKKPLLIEDLKHNKWLVTKSLFVDIDGNLFDRDKLRWQHNPANTVILKNAVDLLRLNSTSV